MLQVRDLAKSYPSEHGPRRLFSGLNFDLGPSGRLAVLGRNGQGKTTLIKILGGVLAPTTGAVRWSMSNSWPLGFGGAFQGGLTGLDNIRFIARIYGRPVERTTELVERFAALGQQLAEPVRFYSSGMRARLAFGLSLAIEFDCYLIDEVFAVGDALFRDKCERELFGERGDRAFIIASHDLGFIRAHCDHALVIEGGRIEHFDDIDTAIEIYESICDGGRRDRVDFGLEPAAEPSQGGVEDRSAPETAAASPTDQAGPDVESIVTRLYQVFLEREPDADGLSYYSTLLTRGLTTPRELTRVFATSDEFLAQLDLQQHPGAQSSTASD